MGYFDRYRPRCREGKGGREGRVSRERRKNCFFKQRLPSFGKQYTASPLIALFRQANTRLLQTQLSLIFSPFPPSPPLPSSSSSSSSPPTLSPSPLHRSPPPPPPLPSFTSSYCSFSFTSNLITLNLLQEAARNTKM